MRLFFVSVFVAFVFTAFAQTKNQLYLAPLVTPFFKVNELGYGGQMGILFPLNGKERMGIALAPTYMKEAEAVMVFAYMDLRIPLMDLLDLTIEPGYNFYNRKETFSSPTYSYSLKIWGGFTAAAGFTVYDKAAWPKSLRQFFQFKYNYCTFNARAESREGISIPRNNNSINADLSGITFSLGVVF